MSETVKRAYNATRRQAAARRTRQAILAAASRLFLQHGYASTTMPAIAAEAGVALDTVYAAIGTKPVLFRLLIEQALSGVDEPIPALERDYVRAMQAEPDARRKLEIYAAAVRGIQQRLAPLFSVLKGAASADPDLAKLWTEISERRAANMLLLAADLLATGAVRESVSLQEIADVVWALNSSEMYVLLVGQRGWTPEAYERWLAEAWQRLLLA